MPTDSWDDHHQHNFQALFCVTPEADFPLLAEISQSAVAYVNAASPKVLRPPKDVQAPMQPSRTVTAFASHGNQGSTDAAIMARTKPYIIRTTVDVPTSGPGNATLEDLSLLLRDAFYDSLGGTLPGISSSPDLVLDTLPSKPLVVDCSIPASLVPSLAEVLMLSRALATAVAVACQKLGCLQYGYTLLLNKHTVLVKDLSAPQASLRSATVALAIPSSGPRTKTTRHLRPQPPGRLALQEPRLGSDLVPAAALPGAFDTDMSCGKELLPVAAVNQVDGSIVGFSEPENIIITDHIDARSRAAHKKTLQYITKNQRPTGLPKPSAASLPAEYDDPHAYIKYLNGNRLPYEECKGFKGRRSAGLTGKKSPRPIYIAPRMQAVLYECGPHFGCAQGLNCPYAITQRGCPYRLELRQTKDKGWALHTLDSIPAGGFVTEYTGSIRAAVLDDSDADSMVSSSSDLPAGQEDEAGGDIDEFAFDMTPRRSQHREGDEEAVNELPLLPALHAQVQHVLDARQMGNAARFANHSCDPNLFVQPVLTWHHDHSQCNICLFAEDDIAAGAELTFDYGDDYVMAAKWRCCCGAKDCVANREAGTTLESVTHLSELCLSGDMSPVVSSHTEDPPCVSNHDDTSAGSTTSHAPSMRTYSSDSTSPSKKRKAGIPAEQAQLLRGFENYPELKQAALGQWPPRREQEPTTGQTVIGQLSDLLQAHSADTSDDLPVEHKLLKAEATDESQAFIPLQQQGAVADCTESEAQLPSSTIQGDTCRQELRQEAEQKHQAIKKLLSLSPTTFRLRGPYVEWRRRGSNEGQQHHDQNVIQLYQKLQQLQAYSSSDAQVEECWGQHIKSLLQC